jgi:hypothetical protein
MGSLFVSVELLVRAQGARSVAYGLVASRAATVRERNRRDKPACSRG